MDKLFEASRFTREVGLGMIKSLRREQILCIPENFNNSLFWNLAHLLVTEQLLSYRLSGLSLKIDESLVKRYGKGSVCIEAVPQEDIDFITENLIPLNLKVQKDYNEGLFRNYKPYETSTGIVLNNIEEAMKFSSYHDGIHLGIMLSLKKIV